MNRSLEIELARRVSHDGLESSRFCGQRIAVPMLMYEAASIHVANSEGTDGVFTMNFILSQDA